MPVYRGFILLYFNNFNFFPKPSFHEYTLGEGFKPGGGGDKMVDLTFFWIKLYIYRKIKPKIGIDSLPQILLFFSLKPK